MHMRRTADRLFGRENYHWSVLGAGRNQMPIAAMAAAMGGNVRVGLEDSLWIGPGKLAESNAAQVTKVRQIIEGLGLEIATPDEAREILALKGGDKVGFLAPLSSRRKRSAASREPGPIVTPARNARWVPVSALRAVARDDNREKLRGRTK